MNPTSPACFCRLSSEIDESRFFVVFSTFSSTFRCCDAAFASVSFRGLIGINWDKKWDKNGLQKTAPAAASDAVRKPPIPKPLQDVERDCIRVGMPEGRFIL